VRAGGQRSDTKTVAPVKVEKSFKKEGNEKESR